MATKRKTIGKKLRFEVFKRDNFTCQYCGKSAPDVILEVDHINPVANGGDNNIMNLITACMDCNRGKGKRQLSDDSEVKKQKKQLEELNQKREQLKMMLDWRKELQNLNNDKVDIIVEEFEKYNIFPNDIGRNNIRLWLKSYDLMEIIECIEISYDAYSNSTNDMEKVFNMVPRICKNRKIQKENPMQREMFYIKGILKNRLPYVNEKKFYVEFSKLTNEMTEDDIKTIKDFARSCSNFTKFMDMFNDYFYGVRGDN